MKAQERFYCYLRGVLSTPADVQDRVLSNNSRRVLAVNCCQAVHLICLWKSSVRLYNFLSLAVRLFKLTANVYLRSE